MDDKIAHLGYIQGAINRMAGNSFLVKGWTVALVAAIFALSSAKDSNPKLILTSVFPIIVFWIYDCYYLRQEKLYRKLFDLVAENRIDSAKFTMDTTKICEGVPTIVNLFFSKSVIPFYALILVLLVVVGFGIGLW
ncbi:hypothetical protein ACOTJG_07150 [Achromobacter xylosoxidans]